MAYKTFDPKPAKPNRENRIRIELSSKFDEAAMNAAYYFEHEMKKEFIDYFTLALVYYSLLDDKIDYRDKYIEYLKTMNRTGVTSVLEYDEFVDEYIRVSGV